MGKQNKTFIAIIVASLLVGQLTISQHVVLAQADTAFQEAVQATQIIHVPGDVGNLQTAIDQISNGGIIELAAGTYIPPSNGWQIHDLKKGFTIRAAQGATVTLDGQGTKKLFLYQNSSVAKGGPITFERLIFARGYTTTGGTAAGLTIYFAEATFVDCVFRDNSANVTTNVGGAVYIAEKSTVFFFNTQWYNNNSKFGGGGLGIRSGSTVYIHESQFTNNHTNYANHEIMASGGAISVGDSDLYISNTRFERNEAGAYGGALYAVGNWVAPLSTPRMNLVLANTTFIENKSLRHSSVNQSFPTEGGAVNVEDQTVLLVHNSRFEKNEADIGGGINNYRADARVYNSVFLGNRAVGTVTNASFGGSISLNSADVGSDGHNNWPSAKLTVEDSYIQGAYESITSVAHTAGCLHISGDWTRMDGNGSIPDMGTAADNRATAVIKRVTLTDCDVHILDKRSSFGGGILATLANLTLSDSVIVNSDARGASSSGGGLSLFWNSIANISKTNFAYNTSGLLGAAIYVSGSQLNLSQSTIFHNEISPGYSENKYESQGALYSTPDLAHHINVSGCVSQNVFSSNTGIAIFELDENGPINDLQYDGNSFYEQSFGDLIFNRKYVEHSNVSSLNQLIINRPNGTTTNKSQMNNIALPSQPIIVNYLLTPNTILSRGASGDPADITAVHLSLVWQAAYAHLDSVSISDPVYLATMHSASTKTLRVAGANYNLTLNSAAEPAADLTMSVNSGQITLHWQHLSGSLLVGAIDNGAHIKTATASGQVDVPSTGGTYRYFVITKEGGAVAEKSTSQPVLAMVGNSYILVEEQSLPVTRRIQIINIGGSTMTWSADAVASDFLTIDEPVGEYSGDGLLTFTVDVADKPCGDYQDTIIVDGNEAGTQTFHVLVKVVDTVYGNFLPLAVRSN